MQDAILKGCFLEGKKAGAPPDIKAVVSAGLEIAMGMAYLHGRDLIHGDLNGGKQPDTFFMLYVHCLYRCSARTRGCSVLAHNAILCPWLPVDASCQRDKTSRGRIQLTCSLVWCSHGGV